MSKYNELLATIKLQLSSILSENSDSIELGDEWTDDHIACCNFTVDYIARGSFNVVKLKIELHWCGSSMIGAIKYAHESQTALNDLIETIYYEEMLDNALDCVGDGETGYFIQSIGITKDQVIEVFNEIN